MWTSCGGLVLAALIAFVSYAPAQEPPAEFDVASVKPSDPASRGAMSNTDPRGRFSAKNLTLRQLIELAWRLPAQQIDGGARWTQTDRFDVDTRAAGSPSSDLVRVMLRNMLAERFALATHTELRELPVYELVVAHPDRGPGPTLRPMASAECDASMANGTAPTRMPGCRVLTASMGYWAGRAIPLNTLATQLTRQVGRVVIDRTMLSGTYDMTIRWTPDAREQAGATPDPALSNAPSSIFTAIEEQLGLKLRPSTAMLDVLVVDRAERPTPN